MRELSEAIFLLHTQFYMRQICSSRAEPKAVKPSGWTQKLYDKETAQDSLAVTPNNTLSFIWFTETTTSY